MQLLIDRDAGSAFGTVTIDGTAHVVDCSSVPPEIARVVWLDDHGNITYRDGSRHGLGSIFPRFKPVIDAWHEKQNAMRTRG